MAGVSVSMATAPADFGNQGIRRSRIGDQSPVLEELMQL